MRAGADVIYQAPFAFCGLARRGRFPRADRVAVGARACSYEAVDTKLARTARCRTTRCSSSSTPQGSPACRACAPAHAHVELGSGKARVDPSARDRRLLPDYARRGIEQGDRAPAATEPYPCDHCEFCAFQPTCAQVWEDADHLTRVAGIRRDHIPLLATAGVTTLSQLAALPPGAPVVPECDRLRSRP